MLARAACLGITLAVARPGHAQRSVLHVDHFTVDDGLAQAHVVAVAQDREGYVWAGTSRGLQRFDGYTFVSYAALDSTSPPQLSGWISALLVDRNGNLWVATPDAIFRRHRDTRRLTRIPLVGGFQAWAPDSAGHIWVRDARLARIDATVDPVHVGVVPDVLPDSTSTRCLTLATTRDGGVWLGCTRSDTGIAVQVHPSTREVRTLRLASVRTPEDVVEDVNGRIWLSGEGGVDVLDPQGTTFRAIEAFERTLVGHVLVAGDSGMLVLSESAKGGGLVHVDATGRVMHRWESREVFAEAPLAHDLMIDREGGMWLATTTTGLFRLDPTRPVFEHLSSRSSPPLPFASDFVMALRESRDGDLWVGTLRGGAYRVTGDWSHVDAFRPDPDARQSLPSVEVWDIDEDRAGRTWITTTAGICLASPPRFRCHRPPGTDSTGVHVEMDAEGWFWIARARGAVVSFDPMTASFGPTAPMYGAVSLYADRDSGYLWMSGAYLHRARISGGRMVGAIEEVPRAASQGTTVIAFRRDHEGVLWLGSALGLERWDVSGGRFVPVSVPELRGTTVFSIEEDANHRLWLGTAHGLVQYSPSTGISRRYRREDGVLNGEFNRRAAITRRTGEMVFGGVHGLTMFTPQRVTGSRESAPVAFTRWRKVTSTGVVDGSFDDAAALSVGPGDRATTIEFATLTFAAGPVRRYRYRLEGVNREWVESADHAVTYAALPPGHFVFRVQAAAGSEGQWHEPGVALPLTVVPPIYRTTWFRISAVVLFALGGWLLHRSRLRQALATERLRLRISRDLHDEIGAGLSSIALLSDSVSGNAGVGDRERLHLRRISQSARQMVDDLRDIVWAIDPDADRLEQIVSRMRDVADTLLPGARVRFHAPAAVAMAGGVGMAARRDLLLIYKELLHNIARHAKAGAVDIRLTARRDEIELVVEDDGRGFDPSVVRSGTGLKSMRERAARIGGRLELVSRNGGDDAATGTRATLTVRRT